MDLLTPIEAAYLVLVHRRDVDEPELHGFHDSGAAFEFHEQCQMDSSAVALEFLSCQGFERVPVQPRIERELDGDWCWSQ